MSDTNVLQGDKKPEEIKEQERINVQMIPPKSIGQRELDQTVVTEDSTHTLTNKTLTSPTINDPTLTSPLIQAPTITTALDIELEASQSGTNWNAISINANANFASVNAIEWQFDSIAAGVGPAIGAIRTSGTEANLKLYGTDADARVLIATLIGATLQAYFEGNVSVLSITDRTPFYEGDALAELNSIKGNDGKIDHASLPKFAKVETSDSKGKPTQERDLGAMISILTVAVQQLAARIETLEKK